MDLLTALGTFARIVETGSFSGVARETGTSHSAITRMVGQLEEHFGVRLLHRTTRRLSLTEDGQDLLGYARSLLETAEHMESALGRQRSTPTGVVRLGIPVGTTIWFVPRVPELLRRYPGLSLDLMIGDHHFANMVEDRLDIAVVWQEPPDTSLISRAVGSFGRIPVASPSYLQRNGAPSKPEDLAQHACIIHDIGPDSAHWRFLDPRDEDKPIDIAVSGPFHANNSAVVQRAALAGIGIALISELQVADEIRAGSLYRLLPDYHPVRHQVYILYPSRRHLPPRVRVTIDFLVDNARELFARADRERVWGKENADSLA